MDQPPINKQINQLIKHTSGHIERPLSGPFLLIHKYGGLLSAACMAVEKGLGSWSRQIGFNVCVRLNDCCAAKPSCMSRMISALWLRLITSCCVCWIAYIHYLSGSALTPQKQGTLNTHSKIMERLCMFYCNITQSCWGKTTLL